jgi:Spy/CpxP family protein refolding chaperone
MTRQPFVTVGCAVLLMVTLAMTSTVSAQAKWWTSERFIKLLGLTTEQSTQLEDVFQSLIHTQRAAKQELDRHEARFSAMLRNDRATEGEVMEALDELEAARSALSKARTLMLYRMRRALTPEQRATLEADRQRAERNRPRQGSGDRAPSSRGRPDGR